MRIAVLMTGLTAYQDRCFDELADRGNHLLLVHPAAMAYAPFDKSTFTDRVQRLVWDGSMPSSGELLPLIDDFDPDVIIMWSWDGKGYRKVMKKWRGKALRVMFSSNFWRGTAKQYAGLLVHGIYVNPLFDAAWVPSERAELFAKRIGFKGRDIIRGANSADTPLFERGARAGDELASHKRFFFTGRLIWHKAPTLLAEAYKIYRTKVDDPWDLVVAGDGPLRTDFEGIDGVDHHGFVQPSELVDLMHSSSAFILPSHAEWYGVVVHEAAASGLPLICSDGLGATAHFLQDGFNGWTFAVDDRDELVDAMVRMSTADADRLQAMSDGSRALASRLSPKLWALNLHEQLERRLLTGRV